MDIIDIHPEWTRLTAHPRRLGVGDDLQVRLRGDMTDPGRCRAVLKAWLPDGADGDVVALVTSELVTNSLFHGSGIRFLRCSVDHGAVRVGVLDSSPERPALRHVAPDEPSGRGLVVIDELSEDWGVGDEGGRKEVWALIVALPGGPPGPN